MSEKITPNALEAIDKKVQKSDQQVGQIAHVETEDAYQKDHMNYGRVDQEVAKYAGAMGVVITPEENKRLKKLVDKRILTIMVFTYFLQALDKGTMSFTSVMGIVKDTGLKGQEFSWLTTCIYIGILAVEYPINWLIQRVPIAKFLGTSICIWGTILCLHAVCTNFVGLVTVRTFLGIFEAVCQPAFVVLSSMWYKREEQTTIVTYWYMMNGMQQIVGGLLAYCFSLILSPTSEPVAGTSPLKSWQAIFITYGVLSVFWGVFVLWFMPDSPMAAKCYTEGDKALMVERVRSNQTGMQNKEFRREQVIEAFKDPQMYCYMMIAICTTLPTSGLGAFANIIIRGFEFTLLQTQLLAMVLGAYIIIVLMSSSWLVKRTHNKNIIIMGIYVIPSFIGTSILMAVRNTSKGSQVGLLISYYIVLSFWAAQTLSMTLITRNIAGQTKKTIVIAANFIAWSTGNAIGPQVFLSWDAPRYFIAFSVHMGCYVILVLVLVFLRFWLMKENSRKDRIQAELAAATGTDVVDGDDTHAFDDLTDRENLNFRYVF